MTQTFEDYVTEWDKLVAQIEAIKKQLKPLTDAEMPMRRAIHAAVATAMGANFKEGMNTYPLADGRKLKVGNTIKREIDRDHLELAREAYARLNDTKVAFDDLLRVKLELEKIEWNKLTDAAKHAVSVMISTKPDTPTVTLD